MLWDADLTGAMLNHAHLESAMLWGTDLAEAVLVDAHLDGALADVNTSWPPGFDWRAAGVVIRGEGSAVES